MSATFIRKLYGHLFLEEGFDNEMFEAMKAEWTELNKYDLQSFEESIHNQKYRDKKKIANQKLALRNDGNQEGDDKDQD